MSRTINREEGMTLVEVLASIVILSIIVVTFLTFFINSARTTQINERSLDAAYEAQFFMEAVYNQVTQDSRSYDQILTAIDELDNITREGLSGNVTNYTLSISEGSGSIQIEPARDDANQVIDGLVRVIVIIRNSAGREEAKLETRMLYEAGES